MAESMDEPKPFHEMADSSGERLKQIVDFWNDGTMDYPVPVNTRLEKHFTRLTSGRKNLKIMVTLCGKTEDLKWLSDQGHDVVGVDIAEKAAKDFFSENNLEYTVKEVPSINGKVFISTTGRIRYYCGNFFLFTKDLEGQFDVIWDAAGFVSLDKRDWDAYLKVWIELVSPECIFLLEIMDYDKKKLKGPPYTMELSEIKEVFGPTMASIELVGSQPMEEMEGFTYNFYCLRRK